MIITRGESIPRTDVLPEGLFLATHYSITGPLCIIAPISGISPGRCNVFYLDGSGGPAIGDCIRMDLSRIEREFLPIKHEVILRNHWS